LTFVVGAIFAFFKIKVTKIECSNQYGQCGDEIFSKLNDYKGQSLAITYQQIGKRLIIDPAISNYSLQLKLPTIIKINIIERKAKYAVTSPLMENFATIDETGFVIAIKAETNLPVLLSDQVPNVGEIISEKKLFAAELVYDMFSVFGTKLGSIKNDSLVVTLESGQIVTFPLSGDKKTLIGTLRLILDNENLSNNITIDLRYKNPVLR